MAITHGQKVLAAVLGVGGAAGVAILVASKAQAKPPPSTVFVNITIKPTQLPQGGGTITISGETDMPVGMPVRISVNGKTIDDFTLTGSSFSEQYDVSPNTSTIPKNLVVDVAVGGLVKSSTVAIEGAVPATIPSPISTPKITLPPKTVVTPIPVPTHIVTPAPKITHPIFTLPPKTVVTPTPAPTPKVTTPVRKITRTSVAPPPSHVPVTVQALFNGKPVPDAAVLIGNASEVTDAEGVAVFELAPDSSYTADVSARTVSSQTTVQECYDELRGSKTFKTSVSTMTVSISLSSVNTICIPFISPVEPPIILPKLTLPALVP